ncbi:MAG: YdcF family protein [Rhodospirillales bacterium]|nr:YdcF family protein [Acetobacter sp.]
MSNLKRKLLRLLMVAFAGTAAATVVVISCAVMVYHGGVARAYEDAAQLPVNDVGLVLGTSKESGGPGIPNPHFYNRIEVAAVLYQAGRVRHLLVSGDKGTRGYDEPADMRAALQERVMLAATITVDDAGFRTLDSVVRAKEVFGQSRLTIVTDRFHVYRALFLARRYGIDAVAFPSAEVAMRWSMKARTREWFADIQAWLDLYVLHSKPRFLGLPIEVKVAVR